MIRWLTVVGCLTISFACAQSAVRAQSTNEPEARESDAVEGPALRSRPARNQQPAAAKDLALSVVLAAAQEQIPKVGVLELIKYRTNGEWAYVTAIPRSRDNQPIDYAQTAFAADYSDGFFDDWLCALLREVGGGWQLVAFEFGATDAPFVDWPGKYGVPASLVLD